MSKVSGGDLAIGGQAVALSQWHAVSPLIHALGPQMASRLPRHRRGPQIAKGLAHHC